MKAPKLAVSIEYDGTRAPKVTAKGAGHIADKIVQIASEKGIPIKQDQALTEMLSQVEIDSEIPPVLYEAMVQVLVFAYQVSGKTIPKP
ncbi:EscU/YscU/HrcU family type III secretion system export apparatus switch protein [Thiomicrospira microaerophila]|uniref:EscU/YscU/HrcU family type III secretion system export apparatus switch protein n=1 Tax=Thiomicrospira microaerophila TaxID=406020 RepID=UPI0005C87913|nr:EscU/YscU/HrcU family type III secretion system export apparatus switch protein [Thiomicrospira microaerophila]